MLDFNTKKLFNGRFNLLNSWITKFYNFSSIG